MTTVKLNFKPVFSETCFDYRVFQFPHGSVCVTGNVCVIPAADCMPQGIQTEGLGAMHTKPCSQDE